MEKTMRVWVIISTILLCLYDFATLSIIFGLTFVMGASFGAGYLPLPLIMILILIIGLILVYITNAPFIYFSWFSKKYLKPYRYFRIHAKAVSILFLAYILINIYFIFSKFDSSAISAIIFLMLSIAVFIPIFYYAWRKENPISIAEALINSNNSINQ